MTRFVFRCTTAITSLAFALSSMSALPPLAHAATPTAKVQTTNVQSSSGWLGVQMERRNTTGVDGVAIQRSVPGSPAEKSGLTQGDVIHRVDAQRVRTPAELAKIVSRKRAGDALVLDVAGPNARRISITLVAAPSDPANLSANLIGRPVPQATALNLSSGKPEDVAPHDGKVRIVELWATWCGPCRVIQPQITRQVDALRSEHFEFVGVAEDEAAAVRAYLQKYPANYRIVLDPQSDVGNVYWSTATPTFVLIDHKGNIADHQSGIDGVDSLFERARVLVKAKVAAE